MPSVAAVDRHPSGSNRHMSRWPQSNTPIWAQTSVLLLQDPARATTGLLRS